MKPEDFDEDFNFKRKRTSDILFILKIIGIMLIVFIIFSFSLSIKKLGGSDSEIEEKGEKYGKSWFIKYQGKISVPIKDLYLAATDGEKVYYKGKVLENADLKTLKRVDMYTEYLADKENVYYKSKLLPIKNNGRLKVVSLEQGEKFLYDEINGYVFKEDYFFDREKSPYKVLGNKGNHMYNMIFVNNEGIYYYDNQEDKLKRAGDNIFIGNLEEVSPNIFTDDENIYYFHGYEVRERYKKTSRNTEIYYLDKKVNWKKVADIEDGVYGSVWQKGDKYYYFNNLGIDSTIQDTIYEIADKETLEYLLNNSGNTDKIKEFIENGKLIQTVGEKKVEIAVEDKKIPDNEKMWFLGALAVVFVVVIILRIKENQ